MEVWLHPSPEIKIIALIIFSRIIAYFCLFTTPPGDKQTRQLAYIYDKMKVTPITETTHTHLQSRTSSHTHTHILHVYKHLNLLIQDVQYRVYSNRMQAKKITILTST